MTSSRIYQSSKVSAIRAISSHARLENARNVECMAGITLLELMVTLSIAAILLTIGVPSFQSIIANNRAAGLSNELSNSLQLARSEAVSRGKPVTVCKSGIAQNEPICSNTATWQNGWLIFVDQNKNGNFDAADDIRLKVGQPLISNAVITSDTKDVTYLPTGVSKNKETFTICVSPEQRTITIESTGRIKIEKAKCP